MQDITDKLCQPPAGLKQAYAELMAFEEIKKHLSKKQGRLVRGEGVVNRVVPKEQGWSSKQLKMLQRQHADSSVLKSVQTLLRSLQQLTAQLVSLSNQHAAELDSIREEARAASIRRVLLNLPAHIAQRVLDRIQAKLPIWYAASESERTRFDRSFQQALERSSGAVDLLKCSMVDYKAGCQRMTETRLSEVAMHCNTLAQWLRKQHKELHAASSTLLAKVKASMDSDLTTAVDRAVSRLDKRKKQQQCQRSCADQAPLVAQAVQAVPGVLEDVAVQSHMLGLETAHTLPRSTFIPQASLQSSLVTWQHDVPAHVGSQTQQWQQQQQQWEQSPSQHISSTDRLWGEQAAIRTGSRKRGVELDSDSQRVSKRRQSEQVRDTLQSPRDRIADELAAVSGWCGNYTSQQTACCMGYDFTCLQPQHTYATNQPQYAGATSQPQHTYATSQPQHTYATTQPQYTHPTGQPHYTHVTHQPQYTPAPIQPQYTATSSLPDLGAWCASAAADWPSATSSPTPETQSPLPHLLTDSAEGSPAWSMQSDMATHSNILPWDFDAYFDY